MTLQRFSNSILLFSFPSHPSALDFGSPSWDTPEGLQPLEFQSFFPRVTLCVFFLSFFPRLSIYHVIKPSMALCGPSQKPDLTEHAASSPATHTRI